MGDKRLVHVVLIMLVLSGWGSGIASANSAISDELTQNVDLKETASLPQKINSAVESSYNLREFSGQIHSPFGSFDPLIQPMPLGPENLYDSKALERTGFVIIQSNSPDLSGVLDFAKEQKLDFIDFFPDDAILVRVPENSDYNVIFSNLNSNEFVRWAGHLPIAWRVSPEVAHISGRTSITVNLEITPAPDLNQKELVDLAIDLESISSSQNPTGKCDPYLCLLESVDALWIPILAMDGRILHIQYASILSIHNSNASSIAGVDQASVDSGFSLNGAGEVIGISDTGIDSDHGDFDGRIRGIFNNFGPDNSAADTNSGHGTHVTATILGDGNGDNNAKGMVPAATFHFYQLEVDSSGIFARYGSLYEMFAHSWQNSARIQTNSWGNELNLGQYSTDSRDVDTFVVDNPKFLVLFSAGDLGDNGSSSVTSPGTAKNVLTVGASSTGAFGTQSIGAVPQFSSSGTTLDGRIKPDVVAPGVMLCSARAQEASSTQGTSCSSATHNGVSTPLYMALNGTSMATAVAAGGVAQIRQYLRESVGVNEPRSDLIKALVINGAEDLGVPDIPNSREGWGQIDISNSISPKDASVSLDLFYDDSRELEPGHSFLYQFDIDSSSEMDLSLVWVDQESSLISNQTAKKIVNDLDLTAIAPDGTEYHGNNFLNGYSTSGGTSDRLNNVERIKISSNQDGVWTIIVGHAGGQSQKFSLVASGLISEQKFVDLAVFEDSLSTSVASPLQGDAVLIQAYWKNQASLDSGTYDIEIWDLTEGVLIYSINQPSLSAGSVKSISFPHVFQTTGSHTLELRLDVTNAITEINDENSGVDNNRYQLIVEISQIGVRIIPLMEDGSLPSNPSQIEQALTRVLEPASGSVVSFDLVLQNEGTSSTEVDLSISPLQRIDENGILRAPIDEWWMLLNDTGPWVLAPSGEVGSSVIVRLTLEDVDADPENPGGAIFALPGDFVSVLILSDIESPWISHELTISTIVEREEGIATILAGDGVGLGAIPGDVATFSLSVKNMGNGPTSYSVICESPSNWIINIGSSNSNYLVMEPLTRLQSLPLSIHVNVPSVNGGQPSAGVEEMITCVTTSVEDNSITSTESAIVRVFEKLDYSVVIFDESGIALPSIAFAEDRATINGRIEETQVTVTNKGNIPMGFELITYSSLNGWATNFILAEGDSDEVIISLDAGQSRTLIVNLLVPQNVEMGLENIVTIKTELIGYSSTSDNRTKFITQEVASLEIVDEDVIRVPLGQTGVSNISIRNSGNVPLNLQLTVGSLPEGWQGGFQSIIPTELEMGREETFSVGLQLPCCLSEGIQNYEFSIIIEASTSQSMLISKTVILEVEVLPSIWLEITSDSESIEDIKTGSSQEVKLIVKNMGNYASEFTVDSNLIEGWVINIDTSSVGPIISGESIELITTIEPSSGAGYGLEPLGIFANSTDTNVQQNITNGELIIQISRARDDSCNGLGCLIVKAGLPSWTLAVLFLAVITGLGVGLVRMRRGSATSLTPEEELIPMGSALQSGSFTDRRKSALETSSSGGVLSSTISDDEISELRDSSLPSLSLPPVPPGAMPLPPSGLPDGWTMEQWVSYGHLWYEQNQ